MAKLTLEQASAIVDSALARGRALALSPISVAVLDDGANLMAFKREDGPGAALRPAIAIGKAWGAVGMGMPSRSLEKRALERPHLVEALVAASGGRLVPVAGGVLIRDGDGEIIGAVGVTGDTSDNDEACAVAGIEAAGLIPDWGE
ncbi:MAG: heme-binding protein [Rhodospirillales bacterium]|jgi:uncharacterized protein GlcG (DUF336 family)|nr:heme-binding protein [Rhodospirillales bacterium]